MDVPCFSTLYAGKLQVRKVLRTGLEQHLIYDHIDSEIWEGSTCLHYAPNLNPVEFLVSHLQPGPYISGTSSDKLFFFLRNIQLLSPLYLLIFVVLRSILLLLTERFIKKCWPGSVCNHDEDQDQEFLMQPHTDVSPENGSAQATYGFVMLRWLNEILWFSNKHNLIPFQCVLSILF